MFGKSFRLGVVAALIATLFAAAAWTVASNWAAKADAKPAPRAVTKYNRTFGNVFYAVPKGYRAIQQEGGIIMVREADLASGDLGGAILITPGVALPPDIKSALRTNRNAAIQALAIASGGLEEDPDSKLSKPEPANDAAKDGFSGYYLTSQSNDPDSGGQRFTQYAIFILGDRAEIAMRIGYGSQAKLEALGAGFDALLASMEFRSAGAPPPTRLAPPLPTDMAAITPQAPAREASPAPRAATQSGSRSAAGVVCRNELRPKTRFGRSGCLGPLCGNVSPTATSYMMVQRVCRRNGQIVDE